MNTNEVDYFFQRVRHYIRNFTFETLFLFIIKVKIVCVVSDFLINCVTEAVINLVKSL